ncbi:hypothetical protein KDJ56_11725 [Brevibacillus composti]|uniref:Uncharacterized protein n=1 Tax=Brevibacillus composti TaxID=2796470 RepID=A0A7T5JM21_9BACL|nr:hypothetical protein [Brevibacillus composti]QQE72647.1 hypothetical protein JD108_11780 [Brevibacillus composti]QUO39725.1 hypothetical protein KDJ56_11725 [Brevibacillus composti]
MSRIVAVVITDSQQVSGGVPVFHAKNQEEQQHLILNLEKILDANAHDLKNGTYILVDHTKSS